MTEGKERKARLAFEMAEIEAKERAAQVNKDMKIKLAQLRDISEM